MNYENTISKYVYIDEYGNPDLDVKKEGVSECFIVVGVFIDPEKILETEKSIINIQKQYFSGSPIKSSNVGKKQDERRINILQEIIKIDFSYYAMIVNKHKIEKNSGLQYKRTFYKYLHKIFCRYIANFNADISITADMIGTSDFMEGFKEYIEKAVKPNLFSKIDVAFANDKDIVQIQISDFVAGTLARIYDPSLKSPKSEIFSQLLKCKRIRHQYWPSCYDQDNIADYLKRYNDNVYDGIIAQNALQQASGFIQKHENDANELFAMQAEVLRFFLDLRVGQENKESVTSDQLMDHLMKHGYDVKTKQYFTSKVIGGLRDNYMIIAGGNDGYRLALDTSDVRDYLKHDRSIIVPMLSRLQKANEKIKSITNNSIDVSKLDINPMLAKIIDEFTNYEEKQNMVDNREI